MSKERNLRNFNRLLNGSAVLSVVLYTTMFIIDGKAIMARKESAEAAEAAAKSASNKKDENRD